MARVHVASTAEELLATATTTKAVTTAATTTPAAASVEITASTRSTGAPTLLPDAASAPAAGPAATSPTSTAGTILAAIPDHPGFIKSRTSQSIRIVAEHRLYAHVPSKTVSEARDPGSVNGRLVCSVILTCLSDLVICISAPRRHELMTIVFSLLCDASIISILLQCKFDVYQAAIRSFMRDRSPEEIPLATPRLVIGYHVVKILALIFDASPVLRSIMCKDRCPLFLDVDAPASAKWLECHPPNESNTLQKLERFFSSSYLSTIGKSCLDIDWHKCTVSMWRQLGSRHKKVYIAKLG